MQGGSSSPALRIGFSLYLEMLRMTLDRDHSPPGDQRQGGRAATLPDILPEDLPRNGCKPLFFKDLKPQPSLTAQPEIGQHSGNFLLLGHYQRLFCHLLHIMGKIRVGQDP